MRRIAATLVPAAALVGVLAPAAHAAPQPPVAPYAQAAAHVANNGDLLLAKNVTGVTNPSAGRYCIEVDPSIAIGKSVVNVTGNDDYRIYSAYTSPTGTCGNALNTVTVRVANSKSHEAINGAFFLTIP